MCVVVLDCILFRGVSNIQNECRKGKIYCIELQ